MGPKGSISPVRANTEHWECIAVFDIGASGAHTKVHGGGMSVARTAAGKYTVTFTEFGPGTLIDFHAQHWAQTDAGPLLCRPTDGSYSSSAGTVAYEAWDLDTTAQTEIPNGDRVTITAKFLKTD